MKKTVLALSLSILSVLGFSAMAQNQKSNEKCNKANKELCTKGKECKMGDKAKYNPFEGLNLTQDQEQKLAALKAQKPERPEGQRPEKKEQMTQEQRQTQMQARQDRSREYLAKVKAILTPEQYVSFLENLAVHKDHNRGGKMMAHKGDRRHDMKKAPRGNRGGNAQPAQPSSK